VTPPVPAGSTKPIGMSDITDGTSNTMMIAEKYVPPAWYGGGLPGDDCGWAGSGWSASTIRSTRWPPTVDTDHAVNGFASYDIGVWNYGLGSPHANGLNAAFADGSVHQVNYEIDRSIFNWLGNREDQQPVLGSNF
jgi:prepilin-type processing-associated H-X9-DG protein